MAKVIANERSWAIDVISEINLYLIGKSMPIKRAGGEVSLKSSTENTLFPDVILYANSTSAQVLQGWELKMPDTPISDTELIKNAEKKARCLALNSFLVWNVAEAVMYTLDPTTNTFTIYKAWNRYADCFRTRQDVLQNKEKWVDQLGEILVEISEFINTGRIAPSSLADTLSNNIITLVIDRNKQIVADYLRNIAIRDSRIRAKISLWWREARAEYLNDEVNEYLAYAKINLLNWVTKLLFSHLIIPYHGYAQSISQICLSIEIKEAIRIFEEISDKCDFVNIFSIPDFFDAVPSQTWADICSVNAFLIDNRIRDVDQTILGQTLEHAVTVSKREIRGQFTTPYILSEFLAKITVLDWTKPVIDPCCGTGTIAKAVFNENFEQTNDIRFAYETTYASDKYSFPLQIANLALITPEAMNIPCRLFQIDAFELQPNKEIRIVNPSTGNDYYFKIPYFGAIVSNLPFVAFENNNNPLTKFMKERIAHDTGIVLSQKSDLYAYLILKLWDLLECGGRIGIITSNSWLGADWGKIFRSALVRYYKIISVVCSGTGRWFDNSDIVTTLLVLEKKDIGLPATNSTVSFCLLNKDVKELSTSKDVFEIAQNSILLNKTINPDIVSIQNISMDQINIYESIGLTWTSFFSDLQWIEKILPFIIPVKKKFKVLRGERRGWDKLFYPKKDHKIEPDYIQRVLKTAKEIESLVTQPESQAFCCSRSLIELSNLQHNGAYDWIKRFEGCVNEKGTPLTISLQRSGHYWYEMKTNTLADFVMAINYYERLFVARLASRAFVNQRLIGLQFIQDEKEPEIYHALFNSSLGLFFIEASGFGRGLGALDLNATKINNMSMLNPDMLSQEHKQEILKAFEPLKRRPIYKLHDELQMSDRHEFDMAVLSAYGIQQYNETIRKTLLSLFNIRTSVRE